MECKFINIQQSTKTVGTWLCVRKSVSLSISNRVLKLLLTSFNAASGVSLSISNRVLKLIMNYYSSCLCVSLSISNRVLKLGAIITP